MDNYSCTKFFIWFINIDLLESAIFFDLVLGIAAAIVRGDGIKSNKLWRTAYKTLIAYALIHLMWSVDKEMLGGQFHTYMKAALIITGFEIWSILESAVELTDHKSFRMLKKLMHDKVKEKTGIDLDSKNNKDKED